MRKKLILFFKRRNHARKQRVNIPSGGEVWWGGTSRYLCESFELWGVSQTHGQTTDKAVSTKHSTPALCLHSDDLSWPLEMLLGLSLIGAVYFKVHWHSFRYFAWIHQSPWVLLAFTFCIILFLKGKKADKGQCNDTQFVNGSQIK